MSATRYRVGEELLSAAQMVELGRTSPDVFYSLFFPRTLRQESAPFHLELDRALEDPSKRFVLGKMFRGSAKTTRLRTYTARRVAYGLSKTIVYVGASEGHASRSIKWVRKQIELNKVFSGVFGLRLGEKKSETEIEVISDTLSTSMWLLGLGYTGNVRGINFDDYRPDLIILDDIITEESAATDEQREKVADLVEGALRGSLAPASEEPNAKMVMLQTPLNQEDITSEWEKDPQVFTITAPIWTKESLEFPIDEQESSWPVRYPSPVVREMKRGYAARNRLSVWMREYEVTLVTPEKRAFRREWLQPIDIMPKHTLNILAIDPLPPPSDREIAKGLSGKDYECLMVVGHAEGNYYCKDYAVGQGHKPNWTVEKFFELAVKHQVLKVVISAIAYEKTLKWILEQEMTRRGIFFQIDLDTDKRKKYHRIVGSLSGLGSMRKLFCHSSHTELIEQFSRYDQVLHEDVLETFALGVGRLANPVLEVGEDAYEKAMFQEQRRKPLRLRGAP